MNEYPGTEKNSFFIPLRDGASRSAGKDWQGNPGFHVSGEIHRFFSKLPVMAHSIDATGAIVSVTDLWLEKLGYTKDEVVGRRSIEFLTKESREFATTTALPKFFEDRFIENIPYQFIRKDRTVIDVLLSAISLVDKNYGFACSLAILTDITEEKRAKDALRNSEQRLRQAHQMAKIGHWDWYFSTGDLVWSDEVYSIFGQDKKTFAPTAEFFEACIHSEDKDRFIKEREEGLSKGDSVDIEHRIVLPDGSIRYVQELAEIIRDKKGEVTRVLGTVQDITNRKEIENRLIYSENLFRLVIQNAPVAMVVFNIENDKIHIINEKFTDLFGYSMDDIAVFSDWWNLAYPDDIYRNELKEIFLKKSKLQINNKKEINSFISEIRCKNGEIKTVKISSVHAFEFQVVISIDLTEIKDIETSLKESEEKYRSMMESIDDFVYICSHDYKIIYMNRAMKEWIGYDAVGNPCHKAILGSEKKCPWCVHEKVKNGHTLTVDITNPKDGRLYSVSNSPIFHQNGTISKLTVFRDITESKRIQEHIKRTQRMEAIGTLSGGIAHDFNNILVPIIGFSQLLLEDFPEASFANENAKQILNAGLRGRDLVKQILSFSRETEQTKIPAHLQPVLKEVIKLSRATIPKNIDIVHNIDARCSLVFADQAQMHQIAMNLITNAYHAVEGTNGTITISLEETYINASEGKKTSLPPGKYAKIAVSDTGHGIDDSIREQIFEPYFTTKKSGKGTGLGLSVVYGIVKSHDGEITVESKLGQGSEFTLFLPVIDRIEEQNDKNGDKEVDAAGSERILLVDDEASNVEILKKTLERLGYKVTARTSSLDALEAFKANPWSFDLIVTDYEMPNMTGVQLVEKIIAIRPGMDVIMCTGYGGRFNLERLRVKGVKDVLMKPAVKSQLAKTVRKVLDTR